MFAIYRHIFRHGETRIGIVHSREAAIDKLMDATWVDEFGPPESARAHLEAGRAVWVHTCDRHDRGVTLWFAEIDDASDFIVEVDDALNNAVDVEISCSHCEQEKINRV